MIPLRGAAVDRDDFWREGPRRFGDATGTDLRIGRKVYGMLRRLGLADITVDYVVVDPLRVPRATFAAIWERGATGLRTRVGEHIDSARVVRGAV